MTVPLPILVENAVQIAWDVLEQSGEITDPRDASFHLIRTIAELVRRGERRRLILINRAIDAYREHRRGKAA
jgi:hypothetical protein